MTFFRAVSSKQENTISVPRYFDKFAQLTRRWRYYIDIFYRKKMIRYGAHAGIGNVSRGYARTILEPDDESYACKLQCRMPSFPSWSTLRGYENKRDSVIFAIKDMLTLKLKVSTRIFFILSPVVAR